MEELNIKPCPFCGELPKTTEENMPFTRTVKHIVYCANRKCFIQPKCEDITKLSVAAFMWNKRTN